VYRSANRRLVFRYTPDWRTRPGAFPLSLSLPLHAEEHGHQAISAFLWGLLPDDQRVIDFWARRHGISRNDVTALLAHVGEDCAGAVQVVPPHHVHDALGVPTKADQQKSVEWLSRRDVARMLTALRENPAAGRSTSEQGQFSLAGAQPKTTLYRANGKWGVPKGRVPSTHILKPPVLDLADLAYNEHACLELARELGLPAARSAVQHFGEETAIVVERYDRERINDVVVRVHQEDMCQALAIQPTAKYESDGGPGLTDVATIIARHSADSIVDLARFVDANVFNWFIAAPDAHAKNYSMLHAAGPMHRLAPLYDVISALPYPTLMPGGATLAMAVNGERRVSKLTAKHWRAVAKVVELPANALLDRIAELGERMPAAIERVVASHGKDADVQPIVARLLEPICAHVTRCLKQL
jgi:serine/threonine-protein kinase HipA